MTFMVFRNAIGWNLALCARLFWSKLLLSFFFADMAALCLSLQRSEFFKLFLTLIKHSGQMVFGKLPL